MKIFAKRYGISTIASIIQKCAVGTFILLVHSTASASGCGQSAAETSLYRSLAATESLTEAFVGVRSLTTNDAKNIAHYRVVTNGCGDISAISYFHGDQPKPIDDNYTANTFFLSSKLAFTRFDNRMEIQFFDHTGSPANLANGVTSILISYDSAHRPARAEFRNKAQETVTGPDGYAAVTWAWTDDGVVLETRFDTNAEKIRGGDILHFSVAKLLLNGQRLLTKIHLMDDNQTLRLHRHEDGSLKSWRAYDENGQPALTRHLKVAGANYAYDTLGYLRIAQYLDIAESPMISVFGHMGFERRYSEAGNRLSYHFIDGNQHQWQPPARGYSGQNYYWREDGVVRVRMEYVDTDGKTMEHPQRGYAAISYEFDENNNETAQRYYNASGDLLYARYI